MQMKGIAILSGLVCVLSGLTDGCITHFLLFYTINTLRGGNFEVTIEGRHSACSPSLFLQKELLVERSILFYVCVPLHVTSTPAPDTPKPNKTREKKKDLCPTGLILTLDFTIKRSFTRFKSDPLSFPLLCQNHFALCDHFVVVAVVVVVSSFLDYPVL